MCLTQKCVLEYIIDAMELLVQMSTDGEIIRTFDSIKEASRTLGLKASSIAYCCKGGYYDKHRNSFHTVSTVGGYKFAYNE